MTVNEWLNNDQLGIDIWTKKYCYNNESFEQWLDRVSHGDEDVKNLIVSKKFLFGGRILANRGLPEQGIKTTMSNCYVLEAPSDSIESIFDTGAKMARTFSYGGGVGIDISNLRPNGAPVNNAARTTSGAVSFMDFFSYITGLIGQKGRRGALMLSISCDHPDLEEFINLKTDLEKCTKANISIRVTDEFMQAVIDNKPWMLKFGDIEKEVNAKDLFMVLAKNNHSMAEPGILYWDRIQDYNLCHKYEGFTYAGVNPCKPMCMA
jgi:ribonucleoside-diphosphate reductase alpha chain